MRSFVWVVASLVLIYAVTAIGTHLLVAHFTHHFNDIEPYKARVVADLKLLATHPIFPEHAREKNAAKFLNGFIGDTKNLETARLETLRERYQTDWWKSWDKLSTDEDVMNLDLAWVDQLEAYDHINESVLHPALYESLATSPGLIRISTLSSIPLLNYGTLKWAAIFRAAQLAKEHRLCENYFRHLADLSLSSDHLIGAMMSVALLKTEKHLTEVANLDWSTIDRERINALKRTTWGWIAILRAPQLGDFASYLNRSTGACAVTSDASPIDLVANDLSEPTWLFEPSNEIASKRANALAYFAKCEHHELDELVAPVHATGDSRSEYASVPFVRRFIVAVLMDVATPSAFRAYNEPEERDPASVEPPSVDLPPAASALPTKPAGK